MTSRMISFCLLYLFGVAAAATTPKATAPACISEQLAMQVLGYTEASWDDLTGKVTQPFSSIKYWASLTADEKAAAGVMGYNQVNWNNGTSCPNHGTPKFCPSWAQLKSCPDDSKNTPKPAITQPPPLACDSERAAGVALGYTQVSWDDLSGKEEQPWSSIKHWAALTDTEQKAAGLLGYTQKNWDNDSKQEPRPAAAFRFWAELAKCGEDPVEATTATPLACNSERAAAVTLGYTQASWDNLSGKERQPWSASKYWYELSDKEQAAAGVFGYTEKTWEGMPDGKHVVSSDQADKHWSELTRCPKGTAAISTTAAMTATGNDPAQVASDMSPRLGDVVTTIVIGWVFLVW